MKTILHIDFNSYFATVEQQANPRLRGKPIGVTGGDRMDRTVLGAASVEAKKFGVKTGMQLWQARKLCPGIIFVSGDSDKYLSCTTKFLNILKDYSPYLEVFSIDECFLELPRDMTGERRSKSFSTADRRIVLKNDGSSETANQIAQEIKSRIRAEIGEYISCSIGISYNKLMAKLAGSLIKPDGLVVISNQEEAIRVLNKVPLDEICGIGGRIRNRLNKMGIFNFKQLREVPKDILLFEFKSYGQFLYDGARGLNYAPIIPFYEKEEVKSVGHRHTIDHDTDNPEEIKQILLKLTELVARRLRAKKLVGRTVHCWFRYSLELRTRNYELGNNFLSSSNLAPSSFQGDGMQATIPDTCDGLEIFKACWKIFHQIWNPSTDSTGSPQAGSGQVGKIRMIGASISNLRSETPQNLSLLPEVNIQEKIIQALDRINDRYGEFTLQRGILLDTGQMKRKPNPFLADRRFKL